MDDTNSKTDAAARVALPSTYINRFWIDVLRSQVRITLAESLDGATELRSAITLSREDAFELSQLILSLLGQNSERSEKVN